MIAKVKAARMNAKQLQRILVSSSAIGILIVGVLVAVVSIVPLYAQLRKDQEQNLQSLLQTRMLTVKEFLARIEDIAKQISSRTRGRQILGQYNQKQLSQDQAVQFLTPILQDALNQSENVVGISRLDARHQLIIQLGLAIPPTQWQSLSETNHRVQISHPIQLQGESYLIITSPILNAENQRMGTDLILFQLSDLKKIIQDYTGLGTSGEVTIGAVDQGPVQLFFPLRDATQPVSDELLQALQRATTGKSGLRVEQIQQKWNVIAFESIAETGWGMAIRIESQELYAPVDHLLWIVAGVIVILILLGTSVMVILLHPLTDQVMIHTDELEQQLQYKTLALQELNYAQEQLLLEIRERKQAENLLKQRAEQLRKHNTVLLQLAKHSGLQQGDLLAAIQAITAATATTLAVERVSVWLYNSDKTDKTSIHCFDLYQATPAQHSQGFELKQSDYPAYFQALATADLIVAHQAQTDERTCEFAQDYLRQLNIKSMLDSPIRIMGETVGVLCIEQVETTRQWRPEDENFVRSIADLVSLAIEARDRHQADVALREALQESKRSQQLLQNIIDTTLDWIFVKNRDFQFILVNQSLAKAFGHSPVEMLGQDDMQLGLPPEQIFGDPKQSIRGFRTDDQRVLDGEWIHNTYDPATAADGSIRILDTQKLPLRDENGAVFAILGISRDITERHRAEAALQKSETLLREKNKILEQTLEELKQTQSQMIQSEKMSSLGQMVGGVAHEINNPVNFIHGNLHYTTEYTQNLLNLIELYQRYYPKPVDEIQDKIEEIDLEFLQADLQKILNSMKGGTERIREIVKSLRNFSRLDEAELKEVNLNEGIDSTLMILNNRLKGKAGDPEIQVIRDDTSVPLVDCYPGHLNQVFMNVISNAIDALEENNQHRTTAEIEVNPNQIHISMKVCRENWVGIYIRDNGCGMTEAVRQQLFDPFFTTKPIGKGTGLGLSISYQIIVEKHQGHFYCHSTLGKGTEFVIEIPVCPLLLDCNQR